MYVCAGCGSGKCVSLGLKPAGNCCTYIVHVHVESSPDDDDPDLHLHVHLYGDVHVDALTCG